MTKLKLEAGKYYRTRDGRKVGPILIWDHGALNKYSDHKTHGTDIWKKNGRRFDDEDSPADLIAEWTDTPTGPVITETVKRIVPGVYGKVNVEDVAERIGIMIDDYMTRDDLTEAIETLAAIRDAL